jgi:hypothetical protein
MLSFGESSSYKSFRGVIKTGDKVGGEVMGCRLNHRWMTNGVGRVVCQRDIRSRGREQRRRQR